MGKFRAGLMALLTCAMASVPSCASMGGGGMKGMFAEPSAVSTQAVSI
jgi:hypothetical protein